MSADIDTICVDFEKRFRNGPTIRVNFSIPISGYSATVLFGPSGCGKTTVLRCLAGLERPEAGSIRYGSQTWFDGQARIHLPPQQRGVGLLFQDYALFPHLTISKNIGFGIAQLPAPQCQQRVAAMMHMLGLDELSHRFPTQLSGGQQQRAALARALVCQPRLLLLDEPLSALDEPTRQQVRSQLRGWLAQSNAPAVIVTHDRREAMALADRVLVLDQGRILQAGSVQEAFNCPTDLDVARIVGFETIEAARILEVADGRATVQVGTVQLTGVAPGTTDNTFVCIRGEDVRLSRGLPQPGVRNQIPGMVTSAVVEGAVVRVSLDCGFPLVAILTRPMAEELDIREGSRVTASINVQAVRLTPNSGSLVR